MSTNELEMKCRELRQLQNLIEEAQAEAEAIKDAIKAHMGDAEAVQAGEYKITWKSVKTARIDTTALKRLCRMWPRRSLGRPPSVGSRWPKMDVKELRAEVRRMVMDLSEEECAEILKEMRCKYDHRRTICTLDGEKQEDHQSMD